MSNTSPVYARIDSALKEDAEGILAQLGISPSSMIQMLYSQIVMQRGIPFDVKLSTAKPVAAGSLTREELDAELWKGIRSLEAGRARSADEVDAMFERKYGG
ncbi:MAG: type II toxin-antitoxin system RelB/DinJ family antitoxin [Ruminococcaceae bacterium]|nr:type II toxin-antitoxin system RelB/DinJ family antitoxin [Oscillospiraceae bacterium]